MTHHYIQNVGFRTVENHKSSGGAIYRDRTCRVEFGTRERFCNVFSSSDYESLVQKLTEFMEEYYDDETIVSPDSIEPTDNEEDINVIFDMSLPDDSCSAKEIERLQEENRTQKLEIERQEEKTIGP